MQISQWMRFATVCYSMQGMPKEMMIYFMCFWVREGVESERKGGRLQLVMDLVIYGCFRK